MNILSIKQAQATIKLISAAGKKQDERIHTVAVSGLAHYFEHGDSTTLSKLVLAMPKSARGNALKFWITKHAPLKWVQKEVTWKKNGDNPADIDAVLKEAFEHPFYEKEDTEAPVFNQDRYLSSVVAKLKKESEAGNANVADFIAALTAKLVA